MQILSYHRVNDENDIFFPGMRTEVFGNQMEYIATHFSVFSLEDAVYMLNQRDIPANAVVVTFDDGYRDNYINAFPILKRWNIPATIFLTTGAIDSNVVLWHDRVFSAFRRTQKPFLQLETLGRYPLVTSQQKLDAQSRVLALLRTVGDEERLWWIDQLVSTLGVEDLKKVPSLMLTWEDVRIMHRAGISFGSHTISHPILSRSHIDDAAKQVSESKRVIEQELGIKINSFAYPSGREADFSATTKALVRDAGYQCAVTTIFGSNEAGSDVFELRRGGPWETQMDIFALKMNYYKFAF